MASLCRKECKDMDCGKKTPTYIRLIIPYIIIIVEVLTIGFVIGISAVPMAVDSTVEVTDAPISTPEYTPPTIVTPTPEATVPEEDWIEFKATAYCPCKKCCGIWATRRPLDENGEQIVYGATGIVLQQGVSVAADTSIYPMGTQLEIEGMGTYTVHDRGGAIKNNKLDIYFENHDDANEFGVRTVRVRVIKEKTASAGGSVR